MNKAERHEAIRERARAALRDMYHNATLPCFPCLYGRTEGYAQDWLNDAAQYEIEYLRDGGAYGRDYAKVLRAECNAGKYKSEKARAYYVRMKMRAMREEREHCGTRADGTPNNALWECISDYGELYQWGRGGRTLAPDDLIRKNGGGSFSIREDYADELPIVACVDLIRILESFNRYVGDWCAGVPEMWREHCAAEDAEALRQKRADAARKGKETRERNYWACRDVVTA